MPLDRLAQLKRAHDDAVMEGWDFSRLNGQMDADNPPWNFEADCLAAMNAASRIVDMGTGGAERLIALIEDLDSTDHIVVATEGWEPNVQLARRALEDLGVPVLFYDADQGEDMPFDDESVDLIMCRHEVYDASEIARVLAPGGIFLTQQVSGNDAPEIHDWFNCEFLYPEVTLERYEPDLVRAGLTIDLAESWEGAMRFKDAEALVTYIGLVPWDAPDFTVEENASRLLELDANPFTVTQRRFRIYAIKPAD